MASRAMAQVGRWAPGSMATGGPLATMAITNGHYQWPLTMAITLGHYPWPLPMAITNGHDQWPLPMAIANGHYQWQPCGNCLSVLPATEWSLGSHWVVTGWSLGGN